MSAGESEDVYDVAKKAEDWEVGECSLCGLPYTRCDCPDDAEDEVTRPGHYYTVVWDYIGGDCGDLPWRFDTEADAIACGEEWVADVVADMLSTGDLVDEGDDGWPVFHVVTHEDLPPLPSTDPAAYPILKVGARWVCDGPHGRFHTRTKAEAQRQLAEDLDWVAS